MIKYYCDLCGQESVKRAKFTTVLKDSAKGDVQFVVKVHAQKYISMVPWEYDICDDCALDAAGIALGFTPKPEAHQ